MNFKIDNKTKNMEKYITTLKELIAQVSRNSYDINERAKKNDPASCFQMGMVYLLGINTAIDFKKARRYFSNQSLVSDSNAHHILGLLSELEGDYSSAFNNYAIAAGGAIDGNDYSYIEKVTQGRECLHDLLNKWKLPVRVLNNTTTSVLNDYKKGGKLKEKSSISIAAICRDEPSCINVAKLFYDSKDYSAAMQWLHFGNVTNNNPLYQMTEEKLRESNSSIEFSNVLEVIEIEGYSLLSDIDIFTIFAPARNSLKEISVYCSRLWNKEVMLKVEKIKNKWEKEEKSKKEREKAEHNALLKQQKAEEARKKKNKRRKIIIIGIAIWIFLGILVSLIPSSSDKEASQNKEIMTSESAEKVDDSVSNNSEEVNPEKYVKIYLEEILPKAIKMKEKDAVEKFFSKDFINLYRKVEKYDNENIDEGDIGFWDFDFWTGGQDGDLSGTSVLKVSDFGNNKASVTVQYTIKFGEYDESKSSYTYSMIFENGKWCIDDLNSYKFRFKEYLNSVGQ